MWQRLYFTQVIALQNDIVTVISMMLNGDESTHVATNDPSDGSLDQVGAGDASCPLVDATDPGNPNKTFSNFNSKWLSVFQKGSGFVSPTWRNILGIFKF